MKNRLYNLKDIAKILGIPEEEAIEDYNYMMKHTKNPRINEDTMILLIMIEEPVSCKKISKSFDIDLKVVRKYMGRLEGDCVKKCKSGKYKTTGNRGNVKVFRSVFPELNEWLNGQLKKRDPEGYARHRDNMMKDLKDVPYIEKNDDGHTIQ